MDNLLSVNFFNVLTQLLLLFFLFLWLSNFLFIPIEKHLRNREILQDDYMFYFIYNDCFEAMLDQVVEIYTNEFVVDLLCYTQCLDNQTTGKSKLFSYNLPQKTTAYAQLIEILISKSITNYSLEVFKLQNKFISQVKDKVVKDSFFEGSNNA